MSNKEVVAKIKVAENTNVLSSWLEDEFSKSQKDVDVQINILIKDIHKQIKGFSSENNYGFTSSKIVIGGKTYKLSNVITNLRFAAEKLSLIKEQRPEKDKIIQFNEADLPEFLADEDLAKMLKYSIKSLPALRTNGKLPRTNSFGLTSTLELFKLLRETTPVYFTPEERVQARANKKRKRKN